MHSVVVRIFCRYYYIIIIIIVVTVIVIIIIIIYWNVIALSFHLYHRITVYMYIE